MNSPFGSPASGMSADLNVSGASDQAEGTPSGRPMRVAKAGAMGLIHEMSAVHLREKSSSAYAGRTASGLDRDDELFNSELAEFQPPPSRRRRDGGAYGGEPAPKRGRGRGRGRGAGSRGGSRSAQRAQHGDGDLDEEDLSTLYGLVRAGKASLKTLVDDWIGDYRENHDAALVTLLQFFISSAGCHGRVTHAMLAANDFTQIIRYMTEEFDEESGDYPIVMAGPQWKRFRTSYCDFIQMLIKQCQRSVIYDQCLMDTIIQLLTGLADSQVRAFRHTATLGTMKLMSSLVDVALALSTSIDQAQRQYDNELSKPASKRASERVEELIRKKTELMECQDEIRNMLAYLFKSVFVHRYRDILPEIRGVCIQELGIWMQSYPQLFLDDSYLKYIGWTLNDKVADVRLKCLNSLLPLYEQTDLLSRLELFTNKFKDRIVSMSLDRDQEVGVNAVKLVTLVFKHFPDLLSARDCESMYELVLHSHRNLALAAGEFLNVCLFTVDPERPPEFTRRGKRRSPHTPLVRDLVVWFIENDLHDHGAYLVDSLVDSNEMMRDWACMTDLLLEEPGEGEEAMTNEKESKLIELMTCSIRQTATGEPPVGRAQHKKYLHMTQKEQKHVNAERDALTTHFIQALPLLLAKYVGDQDKILSLMQIPQYMNLELYSKNRLEKQLDYLLERIEELFEKHTSLAVFEACCKAYECLLAEHTQLHNKCMQMLTRLVEHVHHNFTAALDRYNEQSNDADVEDMFALVVSLRKMQALLTDVSYVTSTTGDRMWEPLLELAQPSPTQHEDPTASKHYAEIASSAVNCLSILALVDCSRTLQDPDISRAHIELLAKRVGEIVGMCREWIIISRSVAETAFQVACDLLIVFGPNLGHDLARKPDGLELLQNAALSSGNYSEIAVPLCRFVNDNVFSDEALNIEIDEENRDETQAQIGLLHRRRHLLSAYCKTIVFNCLPMDLAADVFKRYAQCYNDYGDIIKHTLAKCREVNRCTCARTISLALTSTFEDLQEEARGNGDRTGAVDKTSENFHALRDLAKKFALSFGPDQMKYREAISIIHQEGITFALTRPTRNARHAPPNLLYFEILAEFTSKLMRQDKKTVLAYLDKRLHVRDNDADAWSSMQVYRNSLITLNAAGEPDVDASSVSGVSTAAIVGSVPKRRGRPPTSSLGGHSDLSTPFAPGATSTAVKRPRIAEDQPMPRVSEIRSSDSDSGAAGHDGLGDVDLFEDQIMCVHT